MSIVTKLVPVYLVLDIGQPISVGTFQFELFVVLKGSVYMKGWRQETSQYMPRVQKFAGRRHRTKGLKNGAT